MTSYLGPNTLRALQAMGLLDAILEKVKPEVPSSRPFNFVSGVDHEVIYDVRRPYSMILKYTIS